MSQRPASVMLRLAALAMCLAVLTAVSAPANEPAVANKPAPPEKAPQAQAKVTPKPLPVPGQTELTMPKDITQMTIQQKAEYLRTLQRDYSLTRRSIMLKEEQLRRTNQAVRKKIAAVRIKVRDLYKKVQALEESNSKIYSDADPTIAQDYTKLNKIEKLISSVHSAMLPHGFGTAFHRHVFAPHVPAVAKQAQQKPAK